ncbi:MAG: hypothetical protein KDD68_02185, partial [Bdellovibrionales bacterium]|nr:hypothetical protein [Bdellovibrionales bacterium]
PLIATFFCSVAGGLSYCRSLHARSMQTAGSFALPSILLGSPCQMVPICHGRSFTSNLPSLRH